MLVICNGMIRAGSTLQYNLVRSLAEETDCGLGEGFLGGTEFLRLGELIDGWAEDDLLHIVKSHAIHPDAHEMVSNGLMKICYISRDIRDVAVSAKRKWKLQGSALVERLDDAISIFHEIHRFRQGVLTQRYEEVMENPHDAVKALAAFLDIDVADDITAPIVETCSLESAQESTRKVGQSSRLFVVRSKLGLKVRRILARMGYSKSVYDQRTLLHADHISEHRGQVGIWRSELSTHEQVLIAQRYASWLTRQGYTD